MPFPPACPLAPPCRTEAELDPVTLHNLALAHMDTAPGAGFKKLNFLVSSSAGGDGAGCAGAGAPPEAFANLLLLYCAPQQGFLDLAADVMAENPDLCASLLSRVRAASCGGGGGGGGGAVQHAPTPAVAEGGVAHPHTHPSSRAPPVAGAGAV